MILLERNAEIGGFIATEERTLPGYLHDTFSSWHPMFVSGPAYAALGELLHRHGLEYRNTDGWVTASVADDGRATLAHRDPERTAAEFAHAEDRCSYLAMLQRLGENMASIGGLMGSEVRSLALVRHTFGLVRSGGLRGAEWWLCAAVTSGRAYLRRDFHGHEVDHLYAPWLLHAGLSPDHAGGGLMTPLFAGILHGFGLPVVAGVPAGSWRRSARCWVPSACAWRRASRSTASSWRRAARSAWRLRAVPFGALCRTRLGDAERALRPPPPGGRGRLRPAGRGRELPVRPGGAADPCRAVGAARLARPAARRDPADPPLRRLGRHRHRVRGGGGGTSAAAPHGRGRPAVPAGPGQGARGAAALWLQLQEVPFAPRGDAAGELDTTHGWTEALAKGYADRVLDRIARHAPDLRDKIRAIDVLTPDDLRDRNPNAVSGDPYGGSAELDQSLLWRPLASSGRHATPVGRLWHIGASTHPGAGLGGGSGHLVATTLTRCRAWRR